MREGPASAGPLLSLDSWYSMTHPCFALARWVLPALLFAATANSAEVTYLDCLLDFERYAETIWHDASGATRPADSGYWGDGNSSGNGGIRGSCGVAVTYATIVRSLPGDAQNPTRLARIRKALHYAANTHVSGTKTCIDAKQWGHSWQSAMWAGSMGFACLLVEAELPADTVAACKRAVADEATYRAGVPPASGYVGDTKAEENGWDSNVLALGAAWMADHTNAPLWLEAAKRYLVNTYTVPDASGDPFAPWITTATLYPSFALENHGFYHPTYEMVAGMSLGDSLLMARLANPPVAAELQPFAEHNVMAVWTNNLSALVMDSGDFAYPAGLDWELHDFEQNSFITWMAAHFNDPLARYTDAQLAQCVRRRQIVNGDGRFVGSSGGGFYREAVEARRTAIAWLHWANADFPTGPAAAPGETFMHNTDVEVIHQRSAFGCVSICYKDARVMAVVEPAAASVPTHAFVATPRRPGILGLGALGNPTAAQLLQLTTDAEGFEAELELINGSLGTTHVYVRSTGESIAIVEVPALAEGAAAGSGGSFSCGIENDPLTGGSRLLEWTGGSTTVTNRSGVSRNVTNQWVCVAGRYGLAAGPGGYFNYQAASSYNVSGAAQDTLQFMPSNSLTPRYAVWFPAKTAAQTEAAADLVTWAVTGTNGTLTFPGRSNALVQLHAIVPAPVLPPPYPPYGLALAGISASSFEGSYPPENAVDDNASTFWVSAYGPTNHAEWLMATFTRPVALSAFQIVPRTDNGGYGPSSVRMMIDVTAPIPSSGIPADGTSVFAGMMPPTTALTVALPHPVHATNAVLVITGAYDRGNTNAPRNVQVVQLTFLERALPGTFADWALRRFNDAQLADEFIGGPLADPDQDDVANLLEFVAGGDPWLVDDTNGVLRNVTAESSLFAFQFQERKNATGITRRFERSADLTMWSEVLPEEVRSVQDLGEVRLLEAVFPFDGSARYFRLSHGVDAP